MAAEHRAEHGGVLVALVELRQQLRVEPLVFEVRPRLDPVVVDADPLVRVSDGDV